MPGKEEAQDLINKMKEGLSFLKNGTIDANADVQTKELFRYAHTLKGLSAAIGLPEIEEIARVLERIFKEGKPEKLKHTIDTSLLLVRGLDACQKLLNNKEVADYKGLLEQLNEIRI